MKTRIAFIVYNGFLFSVLVNLLLARFVFVCMYVDFKILFPITWITGAILFFLLSKKQGGLNCFKISTINCIGSFAALWLIYEFIYKHNLWTKPGFVARLAFHNSGITNGMVNALILALSVLGLPIIYYLERNEGRRNGT